MGPPPPNRNRWDRHNPCARCGPWGRRGPQRTWAMRSGHCVRAGILAAWRSEHTVTSPWLELGLALPIRAGLGRLTQVAGTTGVAPGLPAQVGKLWQHKPLTGHAFRTNGCARRNPLRNGASLPRFGRELVPWAMARRDELPIALLGLLGPEHLDLGPPRPRFGNTSSELRRRTCICIFICK